MDAGRPFSNGFLLGGRPIIAGRPRISPSPRLGVACPAGTDELVCAVMEAKALYQTTYNQVIAAWGMSAQGQSFAADQAHAAVADALRNPKLKANWDTYSWWIGDSDIKAEEWPELIANFEQFQKVFNEVPFPTGAGLNDVFIRCVRGLDLYNGFRIADAKLYVNRFSGFWPKTDQDIRRQIALTSLQGLPSIYACMMHKITKKLENEERKLKKWDLIGKAAMMAFTGNVIAGALFSAASQMKQFNDALDFSKFMMGYSEFVEACQTAEAEDFTCTYLAPFTLWAMETLLMSEMFDQVAMEVGLPGAAPGVTQNDVVEPMVDDMKAAGVDVPKAAYTPGGVAPAPNYLAIAGGVGAVGVLALVIGGAFR